VSSKETMMKNYELNLDGKPTTNKSNNFEKENLRLFNGNVFKTAFRHIHNPLKIPREELTLLILTG
jgi:hypothetical protein